MLLQVVLLLYVATITPLRVGFDTPTTPLGFAWWLELGVDVYFLLDFLLNFRMAYINSNFVPTPNS